MKTFLLIMLVSFTSYAGIDENVIITGIISSKFDEKVVHVKDMLGQIVLIPRKFLDEKKIKVESGKMVSFEINSKFVAYK